MFSQLQYIFGLVLFAIISVTASSDFDGLTDNAKILADLDKSLRTPMFGTAKFDSVITESNTLLPLISSSFRYSAVIIAGIDNTPSRVTQMKNGFISISKALNPVIADLSTITNGLNKLPFFQAYSFQRQPILKVQTAFKNMVENTENTLYYMKRFNDTCQKYDMYEAILSINHYICDSNGQVPDSLASEYNRTQYNAFLLLVMGDIINAATLRESCLGIYFYTPDDAAAIEGHQMIDSINGMSKVLQAGDTKIATTFMPLAESIVQQIMADHIGNSTFDQAQLAHAALQTKFDWLQWAQMVSPNYYGNSYPKPTPTSDYQDYGLFKLLDTAESNTEWYRDWVSFWTIKAPAVKDWRSQVNAMMLQNNNTFCCYKTGTYHGYDLYDTARGAKCIIDAINDPDSGIKGVRAYNAYLETQAYREMGTNIVGTSGCFGIYGCNSGLAGIVCAGPA